jgi:hypothetical protein
MTRAELRTEAARRGLAEIVNAIDSKDDARLAWAIRTRELIEGPLAKVRRSWTERRNNWEKEHLP